MPSVQKSVLMLSVAVCVGLFHGPAEARRCTPTPHDEIGPFYRPNAPLRSKIGSGYVLEGTVRSAATCKPIPGARIEFWQAGPDGKYSDAYRATIITRPPGTLPADDLRSATLCPPSGPHPHPGGHARLRRPDHPALPRGRQSAGPPSTWSWKRNRYGHRTDCLRRPIHGSTAFPLAFAGLFC